MSIERAAEETRIRQDFLMRLESDEFDFLAPTYVRGFLKSYSRFLGVPVEPVLDEFDRRYHFAKPDATILSIDRRPEASGRRFRINGFAAAVIAVALLLSLFGIIGLLAAPEGKEPASKKQKTSARAAHQHSSSPSPSPSISLDPLPEETPASTNGTGPISLASGIDLEVVATKDDCWVSVTTDGVNVFADTIPEGDSMGFEAANNMKVVLGFPAGVDLLINGEDVQYDGGVNPTTIELPRDLSSLAG